MSLRDPFVQRSKWRGLSHAELRCIGRKGMSFQKTSRWRVGAERQKYLVDFSYGQEKTSAQKESYWQEKNNPEEISSQKSPFRTEEDREEGRTQKACCKKEACGKEEIIGKKETGYKESQAPPRRYCKSCDP